eukprot:454293-Hanusia_phi.AAC.2
MLLHHHMRDLHKAEEEYIFYLRQRPLDVLALVNYGVLLCNGLGRYSSAKRQVEREEEGGRGRSWEREEGERVNEDEDEEGEKGAEGGAGADILFRILQRAVQLSPNNLDAHLYLNFSVELERDTPASAPTSSRGDEEERRGEVKGR